MIIDLICYRFFQTPSVLFSIWNRKKAIANTILSYEDGIHYLFFWFGFVYLFIIKFIGQSKKKLAENALHYRIDDKSPA